MRDNMGGGGAGERLVSFPAPLKLTNRLLMAGKDAGLIPLLSPWCRLEVDCCHQAGRNLRWLPHARTAVQLLLEVSQHPTLEDASHVV